MAAAQRCLLRGDNACAARALRGHTQNASQEAMLIEATRSLGQSGEAQRLMRQFIEQHPNAPQSGGYRRILEQGGGGTPAPTGLPNPGTVLGF